MSVMWPDIPTGRGARPAPHCISITQIVGK